MNWQKPVIRKLMKKKKLIMVFYIPLFLLGIFYVYMMDKKQINDRETAPKIRFEVSLDELYVTSISFERNDLYLNEVLYDAGGISSYSRVHSKNGLIRLRDIAPPFTLTKKANNDTLQIIKQNKKMYLLVTEEIRYARNN